jgi:uncharacterized protein (DUF433 family)
MSLLERITIDAEICHGKPCIRHMRWPVEVVLDMISTGMSFEEITEEHPELETDDLRAALEFAKQVISGNTLANA